MQTGSTPEGRRFTNAIDLKFDEQNIPGSVVDQRSMRMRVCQGVVERLFTTTRMTSLL